MLALAILVKGRKVLLIVEGVLPGGGPGDGFCRQISRDFYSLLVNNLLTHPKIMI